MYQKIKNKTYSLTQCLKTELSQFCEMPKSGPRYQNHGEKKCKVALLESLRGVLTKGHLLPERNTHSMLG